MAIRLWAVTLVIIGALTAAGCGAQSVEPTPADTVSSAEATAQAQAALESFFDAWKSKDTVAAEAHLAEYKRGLTWSFERLERVEFGPISPDPSWIPEYMRIGAGSVTGVDVDDVRCFRADVTFYYKDRKEGPSPHGEPMGWHWFLHRSSDGQWLVTDWGY